MSRLKALVTAEVIKDQLESAFNDRIEFDYAGYCLDYNVLDHSSLIRMVKDYDILISEYDTVSSDVLEAAEKLKLIICCRGGIKTVVDLDKAMECGIVVCNNAGRNAGAVTDLVMGFIIDMTRNITLTNNLIHSRTITMDESTKPKEYRDTVWGLDAVSPFIKYRGRSINQMKLGLVGFGNAGRIMARKASAFDMKVLAYDPYSTFHDLPDYVRVVSWEELLDESDIISLHCTLTPQTKNMFGKKEFDSMKDGSFFINSARGELVVEEDLIEALNRGKLAAAALDVTRIEPISSSSPLLKAKNLLITPHIGGSANDVQICGTRMVIESIRDYLSGKKPEHAVVYR